MKRFLLLILAMCLAACTNPRERFEDFADRVVDAGPDANPEEESPTPRAEEEE